jgi:DNA-binding LacI/PurR family transcriptional regulator
LFSAVPIQNFLDRAAGFRQALRQNSLQPESCCRIALEPTLEGGLPRHEQGAVERSGTLPTAFFADNDIIACGAMKALQERGFASRRISRWSGSTTCPSVN